MTCAHVLGLIDAGPFADYPRAHLDAAWQHAHACATCGPALKAAPALTTGLSALPQPAPSPELAAAVLARIAQTEQAPARVAAAMPTTSPRSITREWSTSATALGGLAAGLVIVLSMAAGEEARISIASPRVGGMTGLVAMPSTTIDALVLGAGLLLYVAGLFAPLSVRSRF